MTKKTSPSDGQAPAAEFEGEEGDNFAPRINKATYCLSQLYSLKRRLRKASPEEKAKVIEEGIDALSTVLQAGSWVTDELTKAVSYKNREDITPSNVCETIYDLASTFPSFFSFPLFEILTRDLFHLSLGMEAKFIKRANTRKHGKGLGDTATLERLRISALKHIKFRASLGVPVLESQELVGSTFMDYSKKSDDRKEDNLTLIRTWNRKFKKRRNLSERYLSDWLANQLGDAEDAAQRWLEILAKNGVEQRKSPEFLMNIISQTGPSLFKPDRAYWKRNYPDTRFTPEQKEDIAHIMHQFSELALQKEGEKYKELYDKIKTKTQPEA